MELTEYEASIVLEVARKSQETSTYGCMPKLYIEEFNHKNINKYYRLKKSLQQTEVQDE